MLQIDAVQSSGPIPPTALAAPPTRLNPKLTRRGKPPPLEEEEKDGGLNFEVTNPRLNLLHTGTWIPKQFENGRYVQDTGMWTCCRDGERFSLYCESEEVKEHLRRENEALLESEAAYSLEKGAASERLRTLEDEKHTLRRAKRETRRKANAGSPARGGQAAGRLTARITSLE